jgi:hypothetical protein
MYPGTLFRVGITGANTGTEFRTTKMSSSMVQTLLGLLAQKLALNA